MLRIFLVSLVVGVFFTANAASFNWGFKNKITDSSGNYVGGGTGGTAFLYLGEVTSSERMFNTENATYLAHAGQKSSHTFGNRDNSAPSSSDDLESTAAGQLYSIVLLEKSGVESLENYSGNYFLIVKTSGEPYSTQGDPMQGVTMVADFIDYSTSTVTWTAMTPEPTSAGLMLLGLAGLALRRRTKHY